MSLFRGILEGLFIGVLLLFVAVFGATMLGGCSKSNTETVITETGGVVSTTTTTVTETYDLNTEQLTELVTIANNVWNIVSEIIETAKTKTTLTKDTTEKFTIKIASVCFTRYGKFPKPEHIAAYLTAGRTPTETAFVKFGITGNLIEN